MKKLITFILFAFCLPAIVNAQLEIKLSTTDASCSGYRDGEVDCNILTGTSPYTYQWSNGATTANITQLAVGYYHVTVSDGTGAIAEDGININEPEKINIEFTTSDYIVNGRHYNISLAGACNAFINASVTGGVGSYTYEWHPYNQTTQNIANVCFGNYELKVTDANGCTKTVPQPVNEPDKSSWEMTGNTGSNPSSQFIGNTDSVDLSFRTNNHERFRIKGNGQLKIGSTTNVSSTGLNLLFVDANGILQVANPACNQSLNYPWVLGGNSLSGSVTDNFIGTCNNYDFIMYTNGSESMRIKTNGAVGIGTSTPSQKLEVNGSTKTAGLETTTLKITTGAVNGYVLQSNASGNASWGNPLSFTGNLKLNGYWLSNDGDNEGIKIDNNGNVGIGNSSPSEKLDVTGNLKVSGNIITTGSTSSLNINDMHVENKIEVGNSIWLGGTNTGSATDEIYTDDNPLIINGNSCCNFNTILNTNTGEVGIGTSTPAWNTKLHVVGNAIFTTTSGTPAYAPQITATNGLTDATTPDFTWIGNNQTGIFHPVVDAVAFTCGGIEGMRIIKDQSAHVNVGIGITAPSEKLEIGGNLKISGKVFIENGQTLNTATSYDYGLYVGKGILTEKVKIAMHTNNVEWQDKVFYNDYKLMSLKELEYFIQENHHLPGIPSNSEVAKDGIDVGVMDAKFLQKIEELTLHVIQLEKEIEEVKKDKK